MTRPLSLQRSLSTARLGTDVSEDITLPVQTGDEHGPAVLFATRLIGGNNRRLVSSRRYIPKGFAETTGTELVGAAEEFDRIVDVEWGQQKLHGSIMLIA
jgi:hypothetical protein